MAGSCNITCGNDASIIVSEHESVPVNITINCATDGKRIINSTSRDTDIAKLNLDQLKDYFYSGVDKEYNMTVTGIQFGRTAIEFEFFGNSTHSLNPDLCNGGSNCVVPVGYGSCDVAVQRKDTVIGLVFIIILGIMILIYNFAFGCKVDYNQIKKILQRPVAPAIGVCCQFLIMAPLSFGIATALQMDPMTGLGLLAMGCSPGGGGSNVFAYLLDADLELSITLSLISTILALGMTPFWMWALGRFFYQTDGRLKIPIANVFSSLAIVVVPVSLGILLKHFKPDAGNKIAKLLKPFTAVIGTTFIGLGIYVYYYAFIRITWRTIASCFIVPLIGYILGFSAGSIGQQGRGRSITISLETGFQNLALALFMLNTTLGSPESDFAGVVPICYSFISAVYPTIVFLIRWFANKCKFCVKKQDIDLTSIVENEELNV